MAIKTVKFVRALTVEDKQPTQVKDMIGAVAAAGLIGEVLEHAKVIELITPALTTRQPVERILGYYIKPLVDAGLIEIEKTAAKPKLTDEEKAAAKAAKDASKAEKAASKKKGKEAPVNVADELGEDPAAENLDGAGETDLSAEVPL